LYVTTRTLHCRRDHAGLFSSGEYLALEGSGEKARHLFAFARQKGQAWAVVVVPRLLTRLVPEGEVPLGRGVWDDTRVLLPGADPGLRWQNVFTGEELVPAERDGRLSLAVADGLGHFPVGLLLGGHAA